MTYEDMVELYKEEMGAVLEAVKSMHQSQVKSVYLMGPITNATSDQKYNWREAVTINLINNGVLVYNPATAWAAAPRVAKDRNALIAINWVNLLALQVSTMAIVRYNNVPSAGTDFEISCCQKLGKPMALYVGSSQGLQEWAAKIGVLNCPDANNLAGITELTLGMLERSMKHGSPSD